MFLLKCIKLCTRKHLKICNLFGGVTLHKYIDNIYIADMQLKAVFTNINLCTLNRNQSVKAGLR